MFLTIDETGLQDLKAAAGMKPGHLAALRAKIGQEAPLGAPLRAAAAPLPITKKKNLKREPVRRPRAGSRDACRRTRAGCLMPPHAQRQSMHAAPPSML